MKLIYITIKNGKCKFVKISKYIRLFRDQKIEN